MDLKKSKPMQYSHGCVRFKDRVDGNVFSYPKGIAKLHHALYKLFQSSNYEIRDCFYNGGIAQKHGFRL
jgi:hypothetical protein